MATTCVHRGPASIQKADIHKDATFEEIEFATELSARSALEVLPNQTFGIYFRYRVIIWNISNPSENIQIAQKLIHATFSADDLTLTAYKDGFTLESPKGFSLKKAT